ncbi:MAG TPA: class I SAM-dependent methyltransferase [Candidatus Saccharimonadales bacterium]
MNDLQDFWNKNSARIPDGKGQSLYAMEKEVLFPRNSLVCDLGGGTGTDSIYFATKGHDVTLVDIADEPLAKAENQSRNSGIDHKIEAVQCDFSLGALPLPDKYYDVVYSRLALHYFESQVLSRLFAEIYRILRPHGQTYLSLKSPDDEAEMAYLSTTAIEVEDGVFSEKGRLKTRYTIDRLMTILADSGLPVDSYTVRSYREKLGNDNDIVKSGNSEFIVNEVLIQKPL